MLDVVVVEVIDLGEEIEKHGERVGGTVLVD